MTILISGVTSGLGKHCYHYFINNGYQVEVVTRTKLAELQQANSFYDAIIHVAYNTRKDISTSNLADYLQDTLFLTQKLSLLPHKKFIFISSSDVYSKDNNRHKEEDEIALDQCDSIYAMSKLMCEASIQKNCGNHLIIRPTALLGPHAKPNSLMKILTTKSLSLSLHADSSFNYVLHDDVSMFIDLAIKQDLQGIYNFAVNENISLGEVVQHCCPHHEIQFGNYIYSTGHIDNQKIAKVYDDLQRTSLQTIHRFIETQYGKYAS